MKQLYTVCLMLSIASVSFGQLSGTKTVGGTTPDYATLRAAFDAVSAQGVGASGVTFTIRDGVYNEDSLVIKAVTSTSVSAPITIKPASGANVVINVSPKTYYNQAAIKIDSTQYVVIDGSNNGTASKNLTVNALGNLGARAVFIVNSSSNVTVKNSILRTGWTAATDSMKFISIQVTVTGSGRNCNNALIENNTCRNAHRGISAFGVSTADSMLGLIVRNNLVDSISTAAIYTGSAMGSLIYNNDVSVLNSVATGTTTVYGIYIGGGSDRCRVYNNKVHDINSVVGGTVITYGISSNTGSANHGGNVIYNNFVAMNITQSASTGSIYPLYVSESTVPDSILFNTAKLTGSGTSARASTAFYKGSATGTCVVMNNVLINTRTDAAGGIASGIGRPSTQAIGAMISDYNCVFAGTADTIQHKIGRLSTNYFATLDGWRAANGSDGASVSEDVQFVSATDLHVKSGVVTKLKNAGTPIPGYTTDIDGQKRNATTPDIGADEFTGMTSVERIGTGTPSTFALEQNYPNPFNPSTMIRFAVDADQFVTLTVSDMLGRTVAVLLSERVSAGNYGVAWNASQSPSGVYFYTLHAGNKMDTKRMIVMK
jgi:Secretion system C-terminal sorting domain